MPEGWGTEPWNPGGGGAGQRGALIEYLQNATKYTGPSGGGMEMPGAASGTGPDFTGLYGTIGEGIRQSLAEKRKRAEIERALLSEQVVSAQRANQARPGEVGPDPMRWEPWQLEDAKRTKAAGREAGRSKFMGAALQTEEDMYGGLGPEDRQALRISRAGQHLAAGGDVEDPFEKFAEQTGGQGPYGKRRPKATTTSKEGDVTQHF